MKKNITKASRSLETQESLAEFILNEYARRQEERKPFELQWQLNMNFLLGNQYCGIGAGGRLEDVEKQYFWQEREVYNHLAPIVETRLAKLSRVRPKMAVLPSSGEDSDMFNARTATGILNSAHHKLCMSEKISCAAMWSEVCGTSFYKTVWNPDGGVKAGERDGKPLYEGEAEVCVCPPYEIYPDSPSAADVSACRSLIHARALNTDEARDIYGADIEAQRLNIFTLDSVSATTGGLGYFATVPRVKNAEKEGCTLIIEYYEVPSAAHPDGRMIILAGKKVVYCGALPYQNGADGSRSFPFARQVSIPVPGSFWGMSVLERCIPIQRSYNAVKNRKHEFLNRLAMGVLAVEDGSVDVDDLEEEGLSPGKVLIYRQGSQPPRFLDGGRVPNEFSQEEDRLLSEFIYVSGVSEFMRNSSLPSSVTSGVQLQLLIEQDDSRISVSAESVRSAVRLTAQHLLRLYKQFSLLERISRIIGADGTVELLCWKREQLTSEDVIFITENEIGETPAQKRSFIFELLRAGLLHDENGKISNRSRAKILELLNFGIWEDSLDVETLHLKKAAGENMLFCTENKAPRPGDVDDHGIHIAEHTKFMLGGDYARTVRGNKAKAELMPAHIREHRLFKSLTESALNAQGAKE